MECEDVLAFGSLRLNPCSLFRSFIGSFLFQTLCNLIQNVVLYACSGIFHPMETRFFFSHNQPQLLHPKMIL